MVMEKIPQSRASACHSWIAIQEFSQRRVAEGEGEGEGEEEGASVGNDGVPRELYSVPSRSSVERLDKQAESKHWFGLGGMGSSSGGKLHMAAYPSCTCCVVPSFGKELQ